MSLKTNKAVAKRFVVKKSKRSGTKLEKRAEGQDHFNARENGKTKRNKRSDKIMSPLFTKTLLRALPYNN